ncbi:MAG: exodeoxyribonuclease VII large subunit [Endomicrobium sp.]|jgi:exodeoxyribonuclease VII large subunit|nr:exodeoxyribonuclease VII large subunit [Endomicrobium sp.]
MLLKYVGSGFKSDSSERRPLIYTVTQITNEIKIILENSYPIVCVTGALSNFKLLNSGHMYFSIVDANAQLKAVMFKNSSISLPFTPEDGMKVLICGKLSSYVKYGGYQIVVNHMKQCGKGEFYEAYVKLKEKLKVEGIFSESFKKPIPTIVNKIGIVTSQDGAALFDILKVIDNLNANIEVLICPCKVQGKEAENEISKAIRYLNCHHKNLDVLLVGRGGGSIENLWAFNTECVARAIFDSKIPIVSCVGHETDFTITDIVADVRAPTPSAAAEIVLRSRNNIKSRIEFLQKSLNNTISFTLNYYIERFYRFVSTKVLTDPCLIYENKAFYLSELSIRLLKSIDKVIKSKSDKLKEIYHKLDILYPLSILKRGFSICYDSKNKIVKNSKSVSVGDSIKIKFASGILSAEVKNHE